MSRSGRSVLPWIAFALALSLTLYGGYRAQESERSLLESRFASTVDQIDWHLRQRLQEYEQVLRGGVALFMASEEVTRAEWKRYVDHIYLSASYPGIQGIGFARQTLPGEAERLTSTMRAVGQKEFNIRPEGERPVYYPIVYLEPLDWRNQRAVGYDMFSEEIRRLAMTRCRDEGVTALSGRVELVQEVEKGKQAGFLMYLPLYRKGATLDTQEQRREAFLGFVYSPFRMGDFMAGAFAGSFRWMPDDDLVDLEIYDTDTISPDRLMFASERYGQRGAVMTKEKVLPLYGNHWAIRVTAHPAFVERYGQGEGNNIYVGGALFSLLLFALAIRAERRREREGTEERFRSLVTTVPGAVYACQNDEQWSIDFISPHIFDMTGYPPEEFLPPARHRHFADLIVPEDRDEVFRAVQRAVAEQSPFQLEYRIETAQGDTRWIAERGRGVFDAAGRLDHLTGVLFDVTAQKGAETELRVAKEVAESATRMKDQFVNLVAHDLRSPFAAIIGTMQTLRLQGDECMKPEMAGLIDSVIRSGERMSHMIDELLDISRLQTGRVIPRPRFLDAHQAVVIAEATVAFQAGAKGVAVVNRVPPGLRVFADPQLLHEVIQNLLANAVKFLSEGQTVAILQDPDVPTGLVVEDDGPGVAPELAPNLFRHEVKTSTAGTAGEVGTGLGLPYAHDLMAAMGGSLEFDSREGVGARFRILLPMTRPVVLVIDDEKSARMLLSILMRELDVEVIEASGGEEAIALLEKRTVHCVITDLNMPGVDGLQVIHAVKGGEPKEPPPVIVVTADTSLDTRVRIIRAGADDYLTKPVDKQDLIPRLRRFLS